MLTVLEAEVKCVLCRRRFWVTADEVPDGERPICVTPACIGYGTETGKVRLADNSTPRPSRPPHRVTLH